MLSNLSRNYISCYLAEQKILKNKFVLVESFLNGKEKKLLKNRNTLKIQKITSKKSLILNSFTKETISLGFVNLNLFKNKTSIIDDLETEEKKKCLNFIKVNTFYIQQLTQDQKEWLFNSKKSAILITEIYFSYLKSFIIPKEKLTLKLDA